MKAKKRSRGAEGVYWICCLPCISGSADRKETIEDSPTHIRSGEKEVLEKRMGDPAMTNVFTVANMIVTV